MFEAFSGSYYLGRLYVTPSDGSTAAMDQHQHERLNEELYASGEGIERLDRPLVMKLESSHFPVQGDSSVPMDTLAVPTELLEETRIRNPPARTEVFLATRDRAQQLLSLSGGVSTGAGT
ncbi:MAG: DUF5802 family protein [Natrialbaceae archaeon]|nr:DUF5802 family protein [Natrialbaceae archaeon]